MEMPSISSAPRTVEEIFKDYNGRRSGIVRALTTDVEEFYSLCDPEKENLCLYGHPNSSWEVTLPAEEVPPELPEPALGINFARDGMNRRDWISLVAVHSDSWLLSVAFYLGARFNGNERNGSPRYLDLLRESLTIPITLLNAYIPRLPAGWNFRFISKRLFSMINEMPTVFEVVSERKQGREKSSMDSGSKSKMSTKRSIEEHIKNNSKPADEGYGDEEDEHSETLCGTCGGNYNSNEFWIGCDICEKWFHGKCVKITPAKAESIKQYKCPSCSSKKGRQ